MDGDVMGRIELTNKDEIELGILMQIMAGRKTFNLIKRELRAQLNKKDLPSRLLAYHLYSQQNKKNCLVGRKIVKRTVDAKASPPHVEYQIENYAYFADLLNKKFNEIRDTYEHIHDFLDRLESLTGDANLGFCYMLDFPAIKRPSNNDKREKVKSLFQCNIRATPDIRDKMRNTNVIQL